MALLACKHTTMTAPPFYKKINRLVFLILGLWISHNLSAQKPYYYPPDKYIKNNKSSLQAVLQEADFQKGDLIVDIGAGNGWFDLALSDQTDSLTFYLEEIDSLKINPEKLENDIQKFSEVIGKSITNTFIQTLGNEKSTGLDTEFFDHALLIDTYHHFSYSEAMISDIHRILKPEARLLVYELIARKPK